jgi:poly-gamma-glutamate capsule biosynthesis protein CapA/YwtB (metallophosphatase superfamily)
MRVEMTGGRTWLSVVGILAACALIVAELELTAPPTEQARGVHDAGPPRRPEHVLRFLAVGDINLGRWVGQQILRGDTLFPFERVRDSLAAYDVVFANLESNISDQHGRTEHPRSNIIFTAPPAAAYALRRSGFTFVATANNHALDFGVSARNQTLAYLDSAGILHAGTASRALYAPALMERNGIRFAFFAVTDIMNMTDPGWKRLVAAADTALLLPAVRGIRDSVDVVIVSYHGGDEFAPAVTERTRSFARDVLLGGVDLFLGHHPHVPYGVDRVGKGIAFHSLGNFVFKQPDRYWTRFSFAASMIFRKDSSGTRWEQLRCVPLRADFQPEFLPDGDDARKITERIRTQSAQDFMENTQ